MTKGTLTIEFDGVADLARQLRLLAAGAALLDIEAPVVVPRTTDDNTPTTTERVQIGKPDSLCPTAETEERSQTVTQSSQATAVVAPQEPAKDMASSAAPQQPPEKSEAAKADVTLENLSGVPYEALLAFCEQNPGVGINVKMSQPTYFRKTVEHRIKAFLTTPAS